MCLSHFNSPRIEKKNTSNVFGFGIAAPKQHIEQHSYRKGPTYFSDAESKL
jgi:hypothetical protein